jgi:hypothetical protein
MALAGTRLQRIELVPNASQGLEVLPTLPQPNQSVGE